MLYSVELRNLVLYNREVWRCVRDSNSWPHAWQACILTNWTNAPNGFAVQEVTSCCFLVCECKGIVFFRLHKMFHQVFFKKVEFWVLFKDICPQRHSFLKHLYPFNTSLFLFFSTSFSVGIALKQLQTEVNSWDSISFSYDFVWWLIETFLLLRCNTKL